MPATMPRPIILLTNDDSHDSPLFHDAIEALDLIGEVHIVVPATEQSWKGKSMTRFGPLYAERIAIHGRPAWSVTGTPADCVNLGIHNLLEARPDFVVSGINIGKNVGLGFIYSSGTVGACLEANIAGLPALALSQELPPDDFWHWDANRAFRDETRVAVKALSSKLIPILWRELIETGHTEATTWNVNFPFSADADLERVRTRLGHSYYQGCFKQRGDQFHHALHTVDIDAAPDTDDVVLRAGKVSVTLIDIRTLGQGL
jgi:5'-nucleotidase